MNADNYIAHYKTASGLNELNERNRWALTAGLGPDEDLTHWEGDYWSRRALALTVTFKVWRYRNMSMVANVLVFYCPPLHSVNSIFCTQHSVKKRRVHSVERLIHALRACLL